MISRMLMVFVLVIFSSNGIAQDVCTGILTYAGRDLNSESRENYVALSIYKAHCEGSQIRSSSDTTVGIEAVVKAIPVKFNFGGASSKERLSNFCKTYDNRQEEYAQESIDSSTVVREALVSFNDCVNAAARGIHFAPILGTERLVIDVRRGADDATLQGVDYNSGQLTCKLPGPDGQGLVTADSNTVKVLDGNYLPISCERIPNNNAAGVKVYPRAELSILTNRGSLHLPVPAEERLPEDRASAISNRLNSIDQKIEASEEKLRAILAEGHVLAMIKVKDGNVEFKSSNDVSYSVSGKDGTVKFANPKGMKYVPLLTDTTSSAKYITQTHFVMGGLGSDQFKLRSKALDTAGEDRTYVPTNFTAVVVGFE